jgi:hypothetical protein
MKLVSCGRNWKAPPYNEPAHVAVRDSWAAIPRACEVGSEALAVRPLRWAAAKTATVFFGVLQEGIACLCALNSRLVNPGIVLSKVEVALRHRKQLSIQSLGEVHRGLQESGFEFHALGATVRCGWHGSIRTD